jgi:Uma2 family endonuclease
MASPAESVDQRRFSVDEYHRMAEMGIFKPNERVELIRGVVRRMSPKNDPHSVTVAKILRVLTNVLAERASVYPETPLRFVRLDSEPEPDIVVTSSPVVEHLRKANTALVVEVSESSLSKDNALSGRRGQAVPERDWTATSGPCEACFVVLALPLRR